MNGTLYKKGLHSYALYDVPSKSSPVRQNNFESTVHVLERFIMKKVKKINNFLLRVFKEFNSIKLVDKCLIIFMTVLMLQSAFTLFVNEANTQETSNIDIVVRTTSAAIFGYFLSVNFLKSSIRKSGSGKNKIKTFDPKVPLEMESDNSQDKGSSLRFKNQIGFKGIADQAKEEVKSGERDAPLMEEAEIEEERAEITNHQIIIATCIGLMALVTLIIARNFFEITPAMVATISQMRDFVSGCVGFLVGCPSTKDYSKNN